MSFDYGFASEMKAKPDTWKESDKEFEDEDDVEKLKVLVAKDERSRSLYAFAVRNKGVDDDYTTKQMMKVIEEVGYRQINIKCDQEPSTMALLQRILKVINVDVVDQAIHDHPAVGDSQANGSIENGVKTVFGQLRTMRDALQDRLGCRLPLDHPVISWMTSYAARLLSLFNVGHDGHTAYERLRGKKFNTPLPEFGEVVWRKLQQKTVAKEDRGKLQPRWTRAVFIGLVPMSNEMWLWEADKVVKAWRVRRTDLANRWDKQAIENIAKHPWDDPTARIQPQVVFEEQLPGIPAEARPQAEAQWRDLYVRADDVKTHGYTEGCRKCDAMRIGARCQFPHSTTCRNRIREILGPEHPRVARILEQMSEAVERAHEPPPEPADDAQQDEPPELEESDDETEGMEDDEDEPQPDKEDFHMDLLAAVTNENDEPNEEDKEMKDLKELIMALGGNPGKHQRQVKKKLEAMVAEVYSPRV